MIYEEFGLNTYRWFSSTVLRFDNYMEDAIIFCNVDIIDELKEIIDNGGMLNLKRAIHNSSNLFISVNFDNYDVLNIFIFGGYMSKNNFKLYCHLRTNHDMYKIVSVDTIISLIDWGNKWIDFVFENVNLIEVFEKLKVKNFDASINSVNISYRSDWLNLIIDGGTNVN